MRPDEGRELRIVDPQSSGRGRISYSATYTKDANGKLICTKMWVAPWVSAPVQGAIRKEIEGR
jgi:hypothetical protein